VPGPETPEDKDSESSEEGALTFFHCQVNRKEIIMQKILAALKKEILPLVVLAWGCVPLAAAPFGYLANWGAARFP